MANYTQIENISLKRFLFFKSINLKPAALEYKSLNKMNYQIKSLTGYEKLNIKIDNNSNYNNIYR